MFLNFGVLLFFMYNAGFSFYSNHVTILDFILD